MLTQTATKSGGTNDGEDVNDDEESGWTTAAAKTTTTTTATIGKMEKMKTTTILFTKVCESKVAPNK